MSQYTKYPLGGIAPTWKPPVPTPGDLPVLGNNPGDARTALSDGFLYVWNGSSWINNGGTGTVTSVGISATPILTITGSPVTGAGTINIALSDESANSVLAGPTSGPASTPSFRALVVSDIPSLSSLYVTSVNSVGPGAIVLDTDNISEGLTNLYFLTSRARNSISATAPLNYVSSTGVLSIPQSSGSADGYLGSADWTTFNNKQSAFSNQSANQVFAGPSSGSPSAPAFRALVSSDIPALSYVTSVAMTVPSILSVAGSPITGSGTLAVTLATQSANAVLAGPTSGGSATPTFRALVVDDIPTTAIYDFSTISANTSAVSRKSYFCNTSGGAFNVTLPAPALNASVRIKDSTGSFNTNNLTVVRSGSEKIEGVAASKALQTAWGAWVFVSDGTDWFML